MEERRFVQMQDDDGEDTLPKILFTVEEIVRRANPVPVLVFGSRAREKLMADSPVSLQSTVMKEGVLLFDRQPGIIDQATAVRLV